MGCSAVALSLMQTLAPSRAPGSRQDDRVLFTRVRIVGPSMEPGVLNDDWWLVRRTTDVRPGDVIALVHPHRPDLVIVKRIVSAGPSGWWVEGDNASASEDSRQFGSVPRSHVIGRLAWRYRPLLRR